MAHEYFIISPLNLPENKTKDIQVFKISSVFHFKITLIKEDTPCPFCSGKTSIKEYKLRLIINFLLLVFLQFLLGTITDLFVRTVIKPALIPIALVLRTSFNPMRFSIHLPKLYITFIQLIKISLINFTFLFH